MAALRSLEGEKIKINKIKVLDGRGVTDKSHTPVTLICHTSV